MKLYRIEKKKTGGPFKEGTKALSCYGKYEANLIDKDKNVNSRMYNNLKDRGIIKNYRNYDFYPPPDYDNKINRRIKKQEVCACSSKQQFKYWFSEDQVLSLLSKGYHLYEYNVPDRLVTIGEKQVVFWKDRSCRRKKLNVKEIY